MDNDFRKNEHCYDDIIRAGYAYGGLFLPKAEYAKVIHELNSNLTEEERKHQVISKAIGDYIYTAINRGFNDYLIIAKKNIEKDTFEGWEELQ